MKLIHLLRRLLSVVFFAVAAIWQLLLSLIQALLGEVHWQAPGWLCAIQRQLAAVRQWMNGHPKQAAIIADLQPEAAQRLCADYQARKSFCVVKKPSDFSAPYSGFWR